MKTLLVGVGACGNKAVVEAVRQGTVDVADTIIINSTSKDFPVDYEGTKIVLTDGDSGCGKEREIAKSYIKYAIKHGKLNTDLNGYATVIVVSSVEGGTGSGSTPIIGEFYSQVHAKNVHIIAFTGFEDDVRGLANTVEFFKEIDSAIVVHTISNKAFLKEAGGNKFEAERLANRYMCDQIEVITGKNLQASEQNIDDTDIMKVSNTAGYMMVEKKVFDTDILDKESFNQLCKVAIGSSKSIKTDSPTAIRIGIILNIKPSTEEYIDYSFAEIKSAYGNPYELFTHKQWDGEKEYIAIIASGMVLPLKEIERVHDKYKEESAKVNKAADEFFAKTRGMNVLEEDTKFDMIKSVKPGKSLEDFLGGLD